MAITIESANLAHSSFIDTVSRYNKSQIIYWGPRRLTTFKIYKRQSFSPSNDDRFYVINAGTQYRPDLVSFRAYGDPRWWWKIMEVNNINDVFDFEIGRTIVIPGALG